VGYLIKEKHMIQSNLKPNKVLVIGLGQLGLPVAKYVKARGFDTYGYDINSQAMEYAEKIAGIKQAVNFGTSGGKDDFDVFIISISTHKADDIFSPQITGLLSIAQRISRKAKNDALVSIESTVPKGTSKKVFEILNHRLHVVHTPHRWYSLEEKEHGVNQLRVIGGVCDCCLRAGMWFYNGSGDCGDGIDTSAIVGQQEQTYSTTSTSSKSLGIPMYPVPKVEIAEITKITENAHRYLQIAFAEELYLYCQVNNINFAELREALNTKWNVDILEPREGIGGHCLPKDTRMFLESSNPRKSKILTAAIEVDEDYRRFRASLEKNNITTPFHYCMNH
jgi:UDP-N-acetyl-D-mannosaminuronic acid dehydrogenase